MQPVYMETLIWNDIELATIGFENSHYQVNRSNGFIDIPVLNPKNYSLTALIDDLPLGIFNNNLRVPISQSDYIKGNEPNIN